MIFKWRPSRAFWLLGCGLVGACAGCGGSGGPFDYIPVSGRVTFDDGTPIPAKGIRAEFVVQDVAPKDGAYPRVGEAEVDEQGNFTAATSYKYGDGLIPGKHKVYLSYATDAKGKLLIPEAYSRAETTPLIIDTDALPLEIKIPRP